MNYFSSKKNASFVLEFFFCIMIFILIGCNEDTFHDYPLIHTGDVTDIDESGVTFHGKIVSSSANKNIEFGFVWGLYDLNEKSSKIVVDQKSPNGVITTRVNYDLLKDTLYSVQAFIKSNNYLVYGNPVTFNSIGSLGPDIHSFHPSSGTTGDYVTIEGKYFTNNPENAVVKIGDLILSVDSVSSNSISARIPEYTISDNFNIIINISGRSDITEESFFLIGPYIDYFTPSEGLEGSQIVISGINFSSNPSNNIVKFNNVEASVIQSTTNSITVQVPHTTYADSVTISVEVSDKIHFSENKFLILGPEILDFNPKSGYELDTITITGRHFSNIISENIITLSDYNCEIISSTEQEIVVVLPRRIRPALMNFRVEVTEKKFTSPEGFSFLSPWHKQSDVPGGPRAYGVAFEIEGRFYCGLGTEDWNTSGHTKKDFWCYDPATKEWTELPDYPGTARQRAVAFVIQNKAYVGTGYTGPEKKDFWCYDPVQDSWSQISDFGGDPRYGAVAFTFNGRGYVGLGIQVRHFFKDFWEYDPLSDTWTSIGLFPGPGIVSPKLFQLESEALISNEDDIWSFNYLSQTWSYYGALPLYPITSAFNQISGFTIEYDMLFYRYESISKTWSELPFFLGTSRRTSLSIMIGNSIFVATGRYGGHGECLSDFWIFDNTKIDY